MNWIVGKLTSAIAKTIKKNIVPKIERALKSSLQGVLNQHVPPTKEIFWMKLLSSLDNKKAEQFLDHVLKGAVGDKGLEQILQGQGLPILKKVAQIQGGSGLALLNDAEVLNFVADIAADPSHQFDPSKLSHEKKSRICAALETLLRDNPTILLLLGVKDTNVPFCDLRFSTFV